MIFKNLVVAGFGPKTTLEDIYVTVYTKLANDGPLQYFRTERHYSVGYAFSEM